MVSEPVAIVEQKNIDESVEEKKYETEIAQQTDILMSDLFGKSSLPINMILFLHNIIS